MFLFPFLPLNLKGNSQGPLFLRDYKPSDVLKTEEFAVLDLSGLYVRACLMGT